MVNILGTIAMTVISLVGFAGSGKDTAGQHLVDNFGFTPFSFAESLKDALASMFCWDRELLEGKTEESRLWRNTVDEWWAEKLGIPHFTPRFAMQRFGTDTVRNHFHPNMWINNIDLKLTRLKQRDGEKTKAVLIDGRFPNELDMGSTHGATRIRVKRGPEPEWWALALICNGFAQQAEDHEPGIIERLMVKAVETRWDGGAFVFDEGEVYYPSGFVGQTRFVLERELGIHQSEWAWIGQQIDVTIENDGTKEDLFAKIAAYA